MTINDYHPLGYHPIPPQTNSSGTARRVLAALAVVLMTTLSGLQMVMAGSITVLGSEQCSSAKSDAIVCNLALYYGAMVVVMTLGISLVYFVVSRILRCALANRRFWPYPLVGIFGIVALVAVNATMNNVMLP